MHSEHTSAQRRPPPPSTPPARLAGRGGGVGSTSVRVAGDLRRRARRGVETVPARPASSSSRRTAIGGTSLITNFHLPGSTLLAWCSRWPAATWSSAPTRRRSPCATASSATRRDDDSLKRSFGFWAGVRGLPMIFRSVSLRVRSRPAPAGGGGRASVPTRLPEEAARQR